MNSVEALNRSLFLRLNAEIGTSQDLIDAAIVIANLLIYLIPVLLLALWIWGDVVKRSLAIKACLVTLLAMGATQIILQVWQHPRPFMIGLGHTWIPHAADSSFPSDHFTVFAGIGLTLALDGAGWIGIATLAVGLAVAWARIFLGVHFPLDMLGSLIVAAGSYLVLSPVWRRFGPTVTALTQRIYWIGKAR